MEFKIPNKVSWRVDLRKSWQQLFYPSLVKKILKSEDYYNQIVEVNISDGIPTSLDKDFYPLYEAQIVSRPDYSLDYGKVKQDIQTSFEQGKKYKLLTVYEKSTSTFIGATLFSVTNQDTSVSLRVYDREFATHHKSRASIDFWAETKLIEYLRQKAYTVLKHGSDRHPRINNIGRYLFKIQVGGRPVISRMTTSYSYLDDSKSSENKPILFFTNPDSEGFYKKAHIFNMDYMENDERNYVTSAIEWADVELILHETSVDPMSLAGVWDNKDGEIIEKYARRLRRRARFTRGAS